MSSSFQTSDFSSNESHNEGTLCYGDEKQGLSEYSRFFNSPLLSDVTLVVGGKQFTAHKLVLVKSSDVFERMLSADWYSSNSKILELVEVSICAAVFDRFLGFLYTYQIRLTVDTALPVLILADKYNVLSLQTVCEKFARERILPELDLKDVFHHWFQYSSKAGHSGLLGACVQVLSEQMDKILASEEWGDEWASLDKEQLIQIFRSSELRVQEETDVWRGVCTWLAARPDRQDQAADLLADLLSLVRFPMMGPEQLQTVEETSLAQKFNDLIDPYLKVAYKFRALPPSARAKCPQFRGPQFVMRDYTGVSWDKRFVVSPVSGISRGGEVSFKFQTRASSVPAGHWDWELKVYPRGCPGGGEEPRCKLLGVNVLLDSHTRAIEFLLSIVLGGQLAGSLAGRKTVNRNKPVVELDLARCLSPAVGHLSAMVENDALTVQLALRPAD